MTDYIKREDAIKALTSSADYIADALERLEMIEPAEVVPKDSDEATIAYAEGFANGEEAERSRRKRGEWIFNDPLRADFECSECLERNDICTNFCPNCGADMRGESDA